MYRVVTLALLFLVASSLLLSIFNSIRPNPGEIVISALVSVGVAFLTNVTLAKIRGVKANHESAVITGLLIFFITMPAAGLATEYQVHILRFIGGSIPAFFFDYAIIALASLLAVASKFLLVIRRQHIFNAAAFGTAALSVTGVHEFTWWIGTPELFIPLAVAGAVVVHKVRKWPMVGTFLVVGFAVFLFDEWRFDQNLVQSSQFFWLSYSSLFLATFMLTEPFTTPPTTRLQVAYGACVGFLAHTVVFYPFVTMSPELALLVGNAAFYPTTLRRKLFLPLHKIRTIAADTFEFAFHKPAGLTFLPGQYLEWELPHEEKDRRGQRRYFTIASAPSESKVRLAVKILPEGGSSFKNALVAMEPGDQVIASQRAGDFTLPASTTTKIALVAGGIGITPYRSFVQHMRHTDQVYDTVLYYCNNTKDDVAYRDLFEAAAQEVPWKNVFVFANDTPTQPHEAEGFMTATMVRERTPDFAERTWYISGPPGMVNAYEALLHDELEIPRTQIVKDFFPGLA
jgi:ferredoxin-NADP reductase